MLVKAKKKKEKTANKYTVLSTLLVVILTIELWQTGKKTALGIPICDQGSMASTNYLSVITETESQNPESSSH